MSRKLSKEKIELLRKEVLSAKSNYQVARELGMNETTVRNYTNSNRNHLRGLQKHFLMVKQANYKGWSLYFLEDYNKTALNAMVKQKESRVISYHDLSNMSKIFDVKLSSKEKKKAISSPSPEENDYPLAFFCIRMYCAFLSKLKEINDLNQ